MALVNRVKKEINAKIVYIGAPGAGKAKNIETVYRKMKAELRGKLKSMAVQENRLLFFDFLAEKGELDGYTVRFHLYTVTGGSVSAPTWRKVMKGADAVVFVADSDPGRSAANAEAMSALRELLESVEVSPADIPVVLQYNKRDLPDALSTSELQNGLNRENYPAFPAVAASGEGVVATLAAAVKSVLRRLQEELSLAEPVPEESLPEEAPPVEEQEKAQGTPAPPAAPELPELQLEVGHAEVLADGLVRVPLTVRGGEAVKVFALTVTLEKLE